MGCCTDEREKAIINDEQKWTYINLSDFRSSSCLTMFSYFWLWLLVIISIAVYGADTFTAVNLLAFNRWSSSVKPNIPFEVSKWIFAVCIMLSWLMCIYEWIRAFRVIRRGGVAESYLDPLAVVFQSIRGQGWRRFLVFAELTKSKKGVDYVALFVYFQFKGALRIILAEGPRQVVNGVTLYSIMDSELIPVGAHKAQDGNSPFVQFFVNVGILAEQNKEQTVILFTMLFTLVIWVISALCLIVACILYLLFLWHYVPSTDGRLSRYCRRKVDSRLDDIVGKKVQKALAKEEEKRQREERKARKNGDIPQGIVRQPTLPILQSPELDNKSAFTTLERRDTQSTLPAYSSRPGTRASNEAPSFQRQGSFKSIAEGQSPSLPYPPARSHTNASTASYHSNAPLLAEAGGMGYSEVGRDSPALPPMPSYDQYGRPLINRSMTQGSQGSQQSFSRPFSPLSAGAERVMSPLSAGPDDSYFSNPGVAGGNLPRQQTPFYPQASHHGRSSPAPSLPGQHRPAMPPMSRPPTAGPGSMGRRTPGPGPSPISTMSSAPSFSRHTPGPDPYPPGGQEFEMMPSPVSTIARSQTPTSAGGYVAYSPNLHARLDSGRSSPAPTLGQPRPPLQQRREVTDPLPMGGNRMLPQRIQTPGHPLRSVTSPVPGDHAQAHIAEMDGMPMQRTQTPGYPLRSVTNPLPTHIQSQRHDRNGSDVSGDYFAERGWSEPEHDQRLGPQTQGQGLGRQPNYQGGYAM